MKIFKISNEQISMLAGVAAGLSLILRIPTWLVRVIFVISTLIWGIPVIMIYIVLWLILPNQQMSVDEFNLKTKKWLK